MSGACGGSYHSINLQSASASGACLGVTVDIRRKDGIAFSLLPERVLALLSTMLDLPKILSCSGPVFLRPQVSELKSRPTHLSGPPFLDSVASSFLKLIETRSERRGDIRRRQTDKGAIQSRPACPLAPATARVRETSLAELIRGDKHFARSPLFCTKEKMRRMD